MFPNPLVELASDTADRPLLADVGLPQAAGRQAADSLAGLNNDHGAIHPAHLNRRYDSHRGPAIKPPHRTAVFSHVVAPQ